MDSHPLAIFGEPTNFRTDSERPVPSSRRACETWDSEANVEIAASAVQSSAVDGYLLECSPHIVIPSRARKHSDQARARNLQFLFGPNSDSVKERRFSCHGTGQLQRRVPASQALWALAPAVPEFFVAQIPQRQNCQASGMYGRRPDRLRCRRLSPLLWQPCTSFPRAAISAAFLANSAGGK
jgi:hypothetical protein